MGEDDKAPAMTIRIPAPRVLADAATGSPDARTAEVLRALHRAKATIVEPDVPARSPSTETLAREIHTPREWLSKTMPVVEDIARRFALCATALERVVAVPSEKVADFQRSQDGALRELREAVQALKRQVDALSAWRVWWTRRMAAICLVMALLLAGGIGLAWRAHTLAKSTHDILAQILENQERARVAKEGTRR
jgi:hypothetical protein